MKLDSYTPRLPIIKSVSGLLLNSFIHAKVDASQNYDNGRHCAWIVTSSIYADPTAVNYAAVRESILTQVIFS